MQFVDLYAQYLTIKDEIDDAIRQVIEESAFVRGRHVDQFEEDFAKLLGVEHCISCGNGTDALYIALKTLGVDSGDEVITTAHSWIATSETITQAGGSVVFCDTEPNYFCIDPDQIRKKITPKTKGIVVVHLYGQAADLESITEIAREHNLWTIEDCAQAHLASYHGNLLGTFGDIATFSFYPSKNLGAMGDAGCLVTNNSHHAGFATRFARHGGKNEHTIEGINSRLDGLQAAILNVKLRHLPGWTERRRELAQIYTERLKHFSWITVPQIRDTCEHAFHLYVIQTVHRDMLRASLQALGIPTVINYPTALPLLPAYARLGHQPTDFPVASRHAREIMSLPLYPEMPVDDIDLIVEAISAMCQKVQ